MKPIRFAFSFFLTILSLYLLFGLYNSLFKITLFENFNERRHPLFHDYKGVTHIVTSQTRGSQSSSEIIISAQNAKLDFIFFTDLNMFSNETTLNGYHGKVLAFTHPKISYKNGHIFSISKLGGFQYEQLIQWQNQLEILAETGRNNRVGDSDNNFYILAHPFKKRLRWQGDVPHFINGMEVVNLRKLWQELWLLEPFHFFHSILIYPFNTRLALARLIVRENKELELWDRIAEQRPFTGFLGNQTTSKIFSLLGINFSFPTYKESFLFASNHILMESELTGNFESDGTKIFKALKNGAFYFAFDALGSPKGFASYVRNEDKYYLPGSTISLASPVDLEVELPQGIAVPFEIRLYSKGKRVRTSKKLKTKFKIKQSGKYRIEVFVQPKLPFPESTRWIPWIFTNHFNFE